MYGQRVHFVLIMDAFRLTPLFFPPIHKQTAATYPEERMEHLPGPLAAAVEGHSLNFRNFTFYLLFYKLHYSLTSSQTCRT